ncbi:MAG: hypothetical protein R3D62_08860 [Xanthobacteraceae bacterium]
MRLESFVSDLDGGDAILAKGQIVAGNDTMHKALLTLITDAPRPEPRFSHRRAFR